MRQQFIFCAIIFFFIACNNSSSPEQKKVDSATTVQSDTLKLNEIVEALSDPWALTAAEIKDDSVFAEGSIPTSWANAGFTDALSVKKFVKKIQYWIANNQRDSVAASIAFPLRKPAIKNTASFLKSYDIVINDKIKNALREQNLSQLFRNTQGVMVGSGQLWINETPKGIKIIAINN